MFETSFHRLSAGMGMHMLDLTPGSQDNNSKPLPGIAFSLFWFRIQGTVCQQYPWTGFVHSRPAG